MPGHKVTRRDSFYDYYYDDNAFIDTVVQNYFSSRTREIFYQFAKYFDKNVTVSEDPVLFNRMTLTKRDFESCYRILETMQLASHTQSITLWLGQFRDFFIDRNI